MAALLDDNATIVEVLRDAQQERYELVGDQITGVIAAAETARC